MTENKGGSSLVTPQQQQELDKMIERRQRLIKRAFELETTSGMSFQGDSRSSEEVSPEINS